MARNKKGRQGKGRREEGHRTTWWKMNFKVYFCRTEQSTSQNTLNIQTE